MFSFTKWIVAPALAIGLSLAGDAPEAQAQYGCYGFGNGIGISIGGGHFGSYGSYRIPYHSAYRGVPLPSYGHRGWYHDTTHLDYHPTEIRRHGNHYHVQPGHYDVHRSGHWHH